MCFVINFAKYFPFVVINLAHHYFSVIQPMRICYFFCLQISQTRFVNPAVCVQRVYSKTKYRNYSSYQPMNDRKINDLCDLWKIENTTNNNNSIYFIA